MKCPHCPVREGLACIGEHHKPVCDDVRDGLPGRAEQLVEQANMLDPVVRDAVNACQHRGPEGGLVLTEDERSCCGGGAERTACAAGKGLRPGRPTLRECLSCKSA
jgi:hypothetical protein